MLSITKEQVTCVAKLQGETNARSVDCTDGAPHGTIYAALQSHRIHAQVFECGNK